MLLASGEMALPERHLPAPHALRNAFTTASAPPVAQPLRDREASQGLPAQPVGVRDGELPRGGRSQLLAHGVGQGIRR